MAFYRVIQGKHYGDGPGDCDCDNCNYNRVERARAELAKKEKREYVLRLKDHIYKMGDIIETDHDLLSLNQGSRSMKFEMVDSMGRPMPKTAQSRSKTKVQKEEPPADDGLEELSVDELRSMATEEEIDVGSETRKKEIIKLIRTAMVQQAAEAGFRS